MQSKIKKHKDFGGFWERLENVRLAFYVIRDHVADDVGGGLTPLR